MSCGRAKEPEDHCYPVGKPVPEAVMQRWIADHSPRQQENGIGPEFKIHLNGEDRETFQVELRLLDAVTKEEKSHVDVHYNQKAAHLEGEMVVELGVARWAD